ncbi:MAG: hypothetical protein NXY57DRAFT_964423 [Lentinula lateritia]|nr:MAG: hypothetical protein NXY57DRAFT_964423 [Lentinula lateritia]
MELNMLDDGDALDRDHQELSQFLNTQRRETVAASKWRRVSSPVRPGATSSPEDTVKTSHKCCRHLWPPTPLPSVVPRLVRLVLPPGQSSHPQPTVTPTPSLPLTSHDPIIAVDLVSLTDARIQSSPVPVLVDQPGLVQGPTGLVRLAAVAEQRAGADRVSSSGIKGTSQDLLALNMPPSHSRLVPRSSTTHPYCLENERLSLRVRDLEAQLAELQLENSALTSALHDTSHLLEARQRECKTWVRIGLKVGFGHDREVEQLQTSQWEVAQQGLDYSRVLDQYHALERALPGRPEQTLVDRLRRLQEELLSVQEEKEVAEGRHSSSARRNSELQASIVQQQGLVNESYALAAHQCERIETLQEEVHQLRNRASFLKQMVREFLEEGFYEVSLPPVSELEEELTCVHQDLC